MSNNFHAQVVASKNCVPTHKNIASDALRSVIGYSGYGSTMFTLATEVVGYWFDIVANNGTPESWQEAQEVMDHYNEEPSADNETRMKLIGELWNFETDRAENSLDGHIDMWLANIGMCAADALQMWLQDLDVEEAD